MTWWRGQGLEGPLHGPDNAAWHFLVWHGTIGGEHAQRIIFWNEDRTETGVVKFSAAESLHVSKIRDRLRKIAKDPTYRAKWHKQLEFPVERYWSPL